MAGQELEGLDLMRLDGSGRVHEFTVFFRPLPGLAVLTEALATRIAALDSRPTALGTRILVRPLIVLTRIGDRLGLWLPRRVFRR